ncbi:hypothetical protein L2E82_11116 [Cichorium intybus]|uniref:Uncharacterized protein n=1 Tax=Cichorium intybus TaxID=13427 RepID=A0ACB9GDJ8_CICIN|nr:hypothetical protein L2E82_11116 [Cichorium intybus]
MKNMIYGDDHQILAHFWCCWLPRNNEGIRIQVQRGPFCLFPEKEATNQVSRVFFSVATVVDLSNPSKITLKFQFQV